MKDFYKKWWFWTIIAVVIIIAIQYIRKRSNVSKLEKTAGKINCSGVRWDLFPFFGEICKDENGAITGSYFK